MADRDSRIDKSEISLLWIMEIRIAAIIFLALLHAEKTGLFIDLF